MYEVAQRLNLDVNYVEKGTFHGTTLYGKTAPYIVNFPDLKTEQGGSFRITIRPDGSALMERFAIGTAEGVEKFDTQIELKPGFQAVKTPLGKVTFHPESGLHWRKARRAPDHVCGSLRNAEHRGELSLQSKGRPYRQGRRRDRPFDP